MSYQKIILKYGMIPIYILFGEKLYTLLTNMFLHGDFMHLAGNMLYLFIFGDNVEDAFGHFKYLIFYIVSGLGAAIIHILSIFLMPPEMQKLALRVPAIGASGAISGVLGAYMILYPHARIKTLVMYWYITIVSIPAYYYIGFWFIYQLFMGVISLQLPLGVAFWAHIGGFMCGVILVKLLGVRPRKPRPRYYIYYYRVPIE